MDSVNVFVVFEDKQIKKLSVAVLLDSVDAKDYWHNLKKRESESAGIGLSTFHRQPKLQSQKGKYYIESMFGIIQSVIYSKAEPFKQGLAKINHERVHIYEQKEYFKAWTDKHSGGISI